MNCRQLCRHSSNYILLIEIFHIFSSVSRIALQISSHAESTALLKIRTRIETHRLRGRKFFSSLSMGVPLWCQLHHYGRAYGCAGCTVQQGRDSNFY